MPLLYIRQHCTGVVAYSAWPRDYSQHFRGSIALMGLSLFIHFFTPLTFFNVLINSVKFEEKSFVFLYPSALCIYIVVRGICVRRGNVFGKSFETFVSKYRSLFHVQPAVAT